MYEVLVFFLNIKIYIELVIVFYLYVIDVVVRRFKFVFWGIKYFYGFWVGYFFKYVI